MWSSDLARRGSDGPTPRSPPSQRNQQFVDPHHIPLEQVIDDAPALKEKIFQQEEQLDVLGGRLKEILRACQALKSAAAQHTQAQKTFSTLLLQFSDSMGGDSTLAEGLQKCGRSLLELESFGEVLVSQMENSFLVPIEKFYKEDITSAKELSRKASRLRSHYDSALAKAAQIRRRDRDLKTSQETVREMLEARRQFQLSQLDLAFKLNEIESKKKIEFMERACGFMYAQLAYYRQGHVQCVELEPAIRALSTHLQNSGAAFESQLREWSERKAQIETEAVGARQKPQRVPSAGTAAVTDLVGYLWVKKSGGKTWKRRYFRLKTAEGLLIYPKNEEKLSKKSASSSEVNSAESSTTQSVSSTAGSSASSSSSSFTSSSGNFVEINLLVSSVKQLLAESDRRCTFEIANPSQSYILQADSDEAAVEWQKALGDAIAHLITTQSLPKDISSRKSSLTSAKDLPLHVVRAADASNQICADCNTAKEATWASTNNAVVVCIECSGIHRGLGVQCSKVRSLTLDKWDPEPLQLLELLGNAKVNSLLEARLPHGQKIRQDADRAIREKFIRDKYERKAFIDRGTVSPAQATAFLYTTLRGAAPAPPHGGSPRGAAGNSTNRTVENLVRLTLQYLIFGADVNWADPYHQLQTALHAAIDGDVPLCVLELLLQNGANPNLADQNGDTPLHRAVLQERAHTAHLLVKRGASLDAKNAEGLVPLDLAIKHQKANCVTLLRLWKLSKQEENARDVDDHTDSSFAVAIKEFLHGLPSDTVPPSAASASSSSAAPAVTREK